MFTEVVRTAARSGDTNGVTTSGIDTTGADLLIVTVGYYQGASNPTITDSKSNTWTLRSSHASTNRTIRIYSASGGGLTVGSGHTFTANGTLCFPLIRVRAFSGVAASPFDSETGAFTNSGTSQATGSLTPSLTNSLLIAAYAADSGTGTIDVGFSATSDTNDSNSVACGDATLIETAIAAKNPTWSSLGSGEIAVALAVFLAADGAAGGGGGVTYPELERKIRGLNRGFTP